MLRILGTVVLFLSAVYLFSSDNEIVVTGNRVPQDVNSTAKNITVIDSEELEDESSVVDVLEKNAAIQVLSNSGNESYITMGGFGENGHGRVLVLIDGFAVNSPEMKAFNFNSIPVESIERIEILRGASSARYGDQAVAGVINIITKKNTGISYTLFSEVNELVSNIEGGSLSYRIDNFGLQLFAKRDQFFAERDNSDSESIDASFKADVSLNELSVNTGVTYHKSFIQMPGGITEAEYEANPDLSKNNSDTADWYTIKPEINFAFENDFLSMYLPIAYTYDFNATDMTSWGSFYNRKLSTIDAQLISSFVVYPTDLTEVEVVAGFDFKRSDLNIVRFSDDTRSFQTADDSLVRLNTAPWAQLLFSYNDTLLIEAGGRYENSILDVFVENANGSLSFSPFVFDGSIAFIPVDGAKIYASVSQLFRYPFLDEQVVYSGWGVNSINTDLTFEKGLSLTGGVDYAIENIVVNLSAYTTFMEGEIYYDAVSFKNINLGETLHTGGDVYSRLDFDPFSVNVGYGYTFAQFSNGTNEGKMIPLIPNHKISAGFEVKLPENITLSTNAVYNSEYYGGGNDANLDPTINARLKWDASIGWKGFDGFSLVFMVENITNDRTPSAVYWGSYYPLEGRRFNLALKWEQ